MFSISRVAALAALAALAATGAACAPSFQVRTMAAPDAGMLTYTSFRMLPGPARSDGRPTTGSDDPMITNSIANRALRARIVRSFQDRGYVMDERNADFGVAFYATAREKLDLTSWDYGYPGQPGWGRYGQPGVAQYTEGSIVIDVVNVEKRQLVWRGEGVAILSDDASDNVTQLAKAAEAIVAKFPRAVIRAVAVRP